MFDIRKLFFITLLINYFQFTALQTINRSINQDFGKCNCDLTLNYCDLNCCCDTSCSSNDLIIFGCSNITDSSKTYQWCIPNNAIFLQNTPYIITSFGDLICVDINNTVSLNYYQAPLTNSTEFNQQYVNLVTNIVAPQNLQPTFQIPSGPFFNKTNYVWTILPTNNLNVLSLPIQVGSNCRSGPTVYHYQEKASKCLISPQEIIQECSQSKTSTLSLKYFNSIKIIKKPASLSECLSNSQQTTTPFDYYKVCSNEYLITVNLRTCTNEDGTSISIDDCKSYLQPTATNNVCSRLVKSVTYILRFTSSIGIIEAGLDVVFFSDLNINGLTKYVEQKFNVYFIPDSITLSNFDTVYNQKLSGNPGYLNDLPIQAGSNVIPSDRFKRFTRLMPDSEGSCPVNDRLRTWIKFGENVISECLYKPTFDPNLDSYCTLVQERIDNIILGFTLDNRATRFAPFANSDPKDWISIKNSEPSLLQQTSNVNGVCKSVRIGATIQIAFALVGNVINPQAQIQYINYNWNELADINLKCSGQYCANLNDLKLRISTRVIFVNITQPPLYSQSQVSRPKARLPGDFFFPLSNSNIKMKYSFSLFFLPLSLIIF